MQDRKGFTLIELLIVVVIIGILAAIAIPKFSATREKAYYAAMKSDLKNLASQQEIYYATHYQYSTSDTNLEFVASEAVGVNISTSAAATGWGAVATHEALTNEGCAIYYGTGTTVNTPGGSAPPASGAMLCDA